jgi:hypothetical protein
MAFYQSKKFGRLQFCFHSRVSSYYVFNNYACCGIHIWKFGARWFKANKIIK